VAIFKELQKSDVKTARSFLNQLVDVIQNDISGSNTRQKHQVFVTGGIGPGVTSSLWQTIYDQDFSLQTANPIFDITVGLAPDGSTVQSIKTEEDSSGKMLFPSTSLMMREKIDIYKQHAQLLLGDSTERFVAPYNSDNTSDIINEAMFISFKRLFHRDAIKRETFAMKFYKSASMGTNVDPTVAGQIYGSGSNINVTTESGSAIFTDVGSSTSKYVTVGGSVGNIVDSANTSVAAGLLFYDRGIAVFDIAKIISGSQHVSGVIDAMNGPGGFPEPGKIVIGSPSASSDSDFFYRCGNPRAAFIPDFMTSASIDNILDHFCSTRFSSGSETAITFQNVTNINSTLFFARATADEFNYSSNPTFIDNDSRIVVIDEGQEENQRTFAFVTSVGLYDANNNLLAVAKLSRPVEKNDEKDLTFRVRLDF
jgi:hypothetical protein